MDKNSVLILAVEASGLPATYATENKVHLATRDEALAILAAPTPIITRRGPLETNPAYRQVIPYVIVRNPDGDVLTYVRGASGGEARLHGRLSIGAGGHIDAVDVLINTTTGEINWNGTIDTAMNRELEEELGLKWNDRTGARCLGILTENSDDVNRVHIGVVGEVFVDAAFAPQSEEDSQESMVFMSLEELNANRDRLEKWSVSALDAIIVEPRN